MIKKRTILEIKFSASVLVNFFCRDFFFFIFPINEKSQAILHELIIRAHSIRLDFGQVRGNANNLLTACTKKTTIRINPNLLPSKILSIPLLCLLYYCPIAQITLKVLVSGFHISNKRTIEEFSNSRPIYSLTTLTLSRPLPNRIIQIGLWPMITANPASILALSSAAPTTTERSHLSSYLAFSALLSPNR